MNFNIEKEKNHMKRTSEKIGLGSIENGHHDKNRFKKYNNKYNSHALRTISKDI